MEKKMDLHSQEFLGMLMRRQFALSLSIASVFIVIILGVPLLNLFAPAIMNTPVLGFTVSWLLLGFGIFPILIGLAWLFVRRSNAFEDEAVSLCEPSSVPEHARDRVTNGTTSGTGEPAPAGAATSARV
jgi:uncharacterized membrane protein (DUF485 family)